MTDNERTERERVEVTQADRIAAAPMAVLAEMRDLIFAGKADHYAEPFARHRIAALRPAPVDGLATVLFGERTERAGRLIQLIAGENGCISCDDTRLDEFTDDYAGADTINLCFNAGLIDQIGSGDFDDFRLVLLDKGKSILTALRAQSEVEVEREAVADYVEAFATVPGPQAVSDLFRTLATGIRAGEHRGNYRTAIEAGQHKEKR